MWLYFCKYIMMPADRRKIELIYIFRKTQHFNFHKLWYLFFVLYNFALIVFNNAWIVPDFCEQFIFINFYSVVLIWIIRCARKGAGPDNHGMARGGFIGATTLGGILG